MPMASNSPSGNRCVPCSKSPCSGEPHGRRLMDLCFRDGRNITPVDARCLHRPLQIFFTGSVARAENPIHGSDQQSCPGAPCQPAASPGLRSRPSTDCRASRSRWSRTQNAWGCRPIELRKVVPFVAVTEAVDLSQSPRRSTTCSSTSPCAACSSLTGCHTLWQQPWQPAVDPDDLLEVLEREADADVELIALSGEPITRTAAAVERSWSGALTASVATAGVTVATLAPLPVPGDRKHTGWLPRGRARCCDADVPGPRRPAAAR